MFELKEVPLPPVGRAQIPLQLHRLEVKGDRPDVPRKPVLLLHGASASHRTFTRPRPNFADWLAAEGSYDPWLLDWRGSGLVVDDAHQAPLRDHGELYNFNRAAEQDVRAAVDKILAVTKAPKIAVVGFCMGGAVLAEAIALRHLTAAEVDCVVLMALGLFYEAPIDGRLKSEDRLLEHLKSLGEGDSPLFVDPRMKADAAGLRTAWPADLEKLYVAWPGALKFHPEAPAAPPSQERRDPVTLMCNRLSFMFGMPYHHDNLQADIHGLEDPLLPSCSAASRSTCTSMARAICGRATPRSTITTHAGTTCFWTRTHATRSAACAKSP